jgi:tetratricopeptide (TPR) repeat protein
MKKGMALERLGQYEQALTCFDQALEAHPGLTAAYLHKGGLYNRLQRFAEALECYEQALRRR